VWCTPVRAAPTLPQVRRGILAGVVVVLLCPQVNYADILSSHHKNNDFLSSKPEIFTTSFYKR